MRHLSEPKFSTSIDLLRFLLEDNNVCSNSGLSTVAWAASPSKFSAVLSSSSLTALILRQLDS
jgi:hypothetical protein